jgi:hypothetical protein
MKLTKFHYLLLVGLMAILAPWRPLLAVANKVNPQNKTTAIHRYIVYFKDKAGSPFATAQPTDYLTSKSVLRRNKQGINIQERDWPVNPSYVSQVAATGADIWYTSRWLNAAIIECDSATLAQVLRLNVIKPNSLADTRLLSYLPKANKDDLSHSGIASAPKTNCTGNFLYKPTSILGINASPFGRTQPAQMANPFSLNYGQSEQQNLMLGIDSMHDAGYFGQGMTIAVLDAGFANVDRHDCFEAMRTNGQIKGTFDFVRRGVGNVYRENAHGGAVLSIMAGYLSGKLIGPAYAADFFLFRTEDVATEYEIECAYWVIAAERADSLGCDLINSSLGYNTFDNSDQDYSLADLDGQRTFISRAANIAASTGMLVVVSAGNTGGSGAPWFGKITTPSDADSVLTVGAVNLAGNIAGFSSRGPNALGNIKPDVASPGAGVVVYNPNINDGITASSGTSFASPITCGLAAGLWQAYPSLRAKDLHQMIRLTASQGSNPDTAYGYGIPNYNQFRRVITKTPTVTEAQMPYLVSNLIDAGQPLKLVCQDPVRDSQLKIRIYSSTGTLVQYQVLEQYQPTAQINQTTTLGSGIYFLRIQNQKVSRVMRFVVR